MIVVQFATENRTSFRIARIFEMTGEPGDRLLKPIWREDGVWSKSTIPESHHRSFFERIQQNLPVLWTMTGKGSSVLLEVP